MNRQAFEGLLHIWRVTAYYMGVDSESNLVKDDYNETMMLLEDIGCFIVLPAILRLDKISIWMGKCVARSVKLDYHVILYLASKSIIIDNHLYELFLIHNFKCFLCSLWSGIENALGTFQLEPEIQILHVRFHDAVSLLHSAVQIFDK